MAKKLIDVPKANEANLSRNDGGKKAQIEKGS